MHRPGRRDADLAVGYKGRALRPFARHRPKRVQRRDELSRGRAEPRLSDPACQAGIGRLHLVLTRDRPRID